MKKKRKKYLKKKKQLLISFIPDLLSDFLYYDRKECEEVSLTDIKELIQNKMISKGELMNAFTEAINKCSV